MDNNSEGLPTYYSHSKLMVLCKAWDPIWGKHPWGAIGEANPGIDGQNVDIYQLTKREIWAEGSAHVSGEVKPSLKGRFFLPIRKAGKRHLESVSLALTNVGPGQVSFTSLRKLWRIKRVTKPIEII